jgi:hypothetical protein
METLILPFLTILFVVALFSVIRLAVWVLEKLGF